MTLVRDGPIIVLVTSFAVIVGAPVPEAVRTGHPDKAHAAALVLVNARYPPTVPAAAELRTSETASCARVHEAVPVADGADDALAVGAADAVADVGGGPIGVAADEVPGPARRPQPASAIVASIADTA